jgi:hypothetical protein
LGDFVLDRPKGRPRKVWDFYRGGKTSLCPETDRAIAVLDDLFEDADTA